jgi:hypothetical protein
MGKHSRIGIVLWTANRYISEHPRCGLGEVMRHTCATLGLRNVSFMTMSAGRCKFWTRVQRRLPGSNRVLWLYSVSPLGEELAAEPQPPSLKEMAARSITRRRSMAHPADWATDAQPGELLTPRGGSVKGGCWGHRVNQPIHLDDGSGTGNLVYNSRRMTQVPQGSILIFHARDEESFRATRDFYERMTNIGGVLVVSPEGEILCVEVQLLKPIQRRKYVRPTITGI